MANIDCGSSRCRLIRHTHDTVSSISCCTGSFLATVTWLHGGPFTQRDCFWCCGCAFSSFATPGRSTTINNLIAWLLLARDPCCLTEPSLSLDKQQQADHVIISSDQEIDDISWYILPFFIKSYMLLAMMHFVLQPTLVRAPPGHQNSGRGCSWISLINRAVGMASPPMANLDGYPYPYPY